MSRRAVTLASAGLLVVLLSAVAALLPVPYVALLPGPTTNTLGEVKSQALIRIDGRPTYPDNGHLDLTTVSVVGGPQRRMDLLTAMRGWLSRRISIVPEETIYPEGQTAKQAEVQSNNEMRDSQENATTAALRHLGIPVTTRVTVQSLAPGSAARGRLRKGDLLVAVDGRAVDGGATLREVVTKHKPGERVRLVVDRAGERRDVTVTTRKAPDDGRAIVGISTRDEADYPFTVDISLRDVGGPSAGLMFALGIVDKLTPGSLTGGAYVAGTGTIDDQGDVGAIGGVPQKMLGAKKSGATIFLSPAGNCAEAVRNKPDDLRLVRVTDLPSAVLSLEKLRDNPDAKVPSC